MQQKPNIFIGISLMYVVTIVLLFIMAPVQQAFGMWGVAITQIALLTCAILPAIILKWNLKEVFSIKKPTIRQIFGTIILWVSTFFIATAAAAILMAILPQQMTDVSNGLTNVIHSLPLPLSFFIVAVMPAICEEALHRGFILHTFKDVKSKWTIIITMGVIFGLFHLDPYRFLSTAILGITLTYVMLETGNMILPMLFHFINNALSVLATSTVTAPQTVEMVSDVNNIMATVGSGLFLASFAPLLFLWGRKLIHTKEYNKEHKLSSKVVAIIIIASVILCVTGLGIISRSITNV